MKKLNFLIAGAMLSAAAFSNAGAVISGGNVKLGVGNWGQLNFGTSVPDVAGQTKVGVRYLRDGREYESTSHGCECEGWGVGISSTGLAGYANNSGGTAGLTALGFSSTASTAESVVGVSGKLRVTHSFALSTETNNLYKVAVKIENTSGTDLADLVYRRTFDWDTSPTPFREYVTIGGTATAAYVTKATNNGFTSSSPFATNNPILPGALGDFTAKGPHDHGANFDFNFGKLESGQSFEFNIFYGAADNRVDALAALGEVGAEVYSLGWSGTDADQNGFDDLSARRTPTFIFGFDGVGGVDLPDPTPVSESASLFLMGLGLLGLGARRRLTK